MQPGKYWRVWRCKVYFGVGRVSCLLATHFLRRFFPVTYPLIYDIVSAVLKKYIGERRTVNLHLMTVLQLKMLNEMEIRSRVVN
jgi:hypothetical protein